MIVDFTAIDTAAQAKGLKLTGSGPILMWSGRSGVVRLEAAVDLLDGTATFTVRTPFDEPHITYFLTTDALVEWLRKH